MDLEYINNLKKIKKEKELIIKKERELTKPIITDFSLLPKIHDIFWDILEERDCPPRKGSSLQKKKFFLVVMVLCSPSYFVGEKMGKGLRRALLKISEYHYPSNLSYTCKSIVDQYLIYKDLRTEISDLTSQITERLKDEGYI